MSDKPKCYCCPECGSIPCPSVKQGGKCENACHCDAWDDEPADPFEDAMHECGQMPDGICTLAGTEHCDFECPFRD